MGFYLFLHNWKELFKTRFALVAQSVERVLGKDEVTGSNPVKGSSLEDNININL